MPGITIKRQGDFQYVEFTSFAATGLVTHCFTTRHGGIGVGPYGSLNMALHVGDEPATVLANRKIACAALGINPAHLVAAVQVHGHRVQVVGEEHKGSGAMDYSTAIPDTDALITSVPGVPLSSYYADCVPILLLDPVKVVVGLAHAGWRGTVQRIAGETVKKMSQVFGSDPGDILAGIGPSIGPCCYEVDLPVQQAVSQAFSRWQELLKPTKPGYWLLDLWAANRRALLDAGIREQHITVARLCTSCRTDLFFSYRTNGQTGRMASLIMIK